MSDPGAVASHEPTPADIAKADAMLRDCLRHLDGAGLGLIALHVSLALERLHEGWGDRLSADGPE